MNNFNLLNNKKILLTGGAGYIGSHVAVKLLEYDVELYIIDDLSNSSIKAIEHIKELSNKKIHFKQLNLCNSIELANYFKINNNFDACFHFAGLKAVGESVQIPLKYYKNNIYGSLNLFENLANINCYHIIFSSSATVYGMPEVLPINELAKLSCTNPYGRTKLYIEEILQDLSITKPNKWRIASLRYFNPVGAHASGKIGEDPKGIPNNLCPYISQVAIGKLPYLQVFGNDYDTIDGTGIRDYIHVDDLAVGHLAALCHGLYDVNKKDAYQTYNLGTGQGTSVLQVVSAMEKAIGKKIPYKIVGRRKGDVATVYADCTKANKQLNWYAKKTIEQAMIDSWKWQSQFPNGFNY